MMGVELIILFIILEHKL